MGRDKASLEVDGVPMAVRVSRALNDAGATDVFCVGGEPVADLRLVRDDNPGEGPLSGLITALHHAEHDLVVVLSCDLVEPSAAAITKLVSESGGAAATIPVVDGRQQWLHGAWSRAACLGPLVAAFDAGERAIHRAATALEIRLVEASGSGFLDADAPEDLSR
jgi:molybdopterin-guanine dinucleotide biosynthesis protein A